MDALQAVAYMMARTETKPSDLARLTEKSPQNINKLVNRDVSDMKVSNFAQVAQAMGWRLQVTDGSETVDVS